MTLTSVQIFFALVAFSLSMAIASGALRMYFYDYDFEPDSIPNGTYCHGQCALPRCQDTFAVCGGPKSLWSETRRLSIVHKP